MSNKSIKTSEVHTKGLNLFIYFTLILITLLVFWQVRHFDFINLDDNGYVYDNQNVINGLTTKSVVWAFTEYKFAYWIPLTYLSYMLDCQLFGLDPGWMHLVNVIFHIFNTLLLYFVFKKMTGSLWSSAFVAAAFAIHPMHVESVAWITERKDVLSTFFLLLTIVAYRSYTQRPSVFRYIGIFILFLLGLMTKPMLVTLPFLLLLLDYWPLNRFEIQDLGLTARSKFFRLVIEKIPLLTLAFVLSAVTFFAQRVAGAMRDIETLSLQKRLANVILSYARYIGKMFWPKNMAVFYSFDVTKNIPFWSVMLCILLLIGITLLVLLLGRSRKYLPVGWIWFIGTLIPVIGLVHVGAQAYADRYTYISYIGLFIMIAWGLPELLSKWAYSKKILGLLMPVVLLVLGACSYRQTSYWEDSITLFSHGATVTKDNYVLWNYLGSAYEKAGQYEKAIQASRKSTTINPYYAEGYYYLGNVYSRIGRYKDAIEVYNQAINIEPEYTECHNNLGSAYHQIGRYQEAINSFKQVIEIKPDKYKAYNNLGLAYSRLGRHKRGIKAYKQAIKIDPQYTDAYNNLGAAYHSLGQNQEAVEAFNQAALLAPNDPKTYDNLGLAYYHLSRFEEAVEAFEQAIKSDPQYVDAYNNLGATYKALGRHEEMIKAYKEAIKINPQFVSPYNNLGVEYNNLGRPQEAIEISKRLAKIAPGNPEAYYNLGVAYSGLGVWREAIEAFNQVLQINPQDPRVHYNVGVIYSKLDRWNKAIQAFGQAIKVAPNNVAAHFALGIAYLQVGDKQSALKEYQILKALNPKVANDLFNMINR